MKHGFVTLVGAGPGPGLMTLAGLEALRAAEVVIYDDLIDPELLKEAPNAEMVYVGKRRGQHSASQEEILTLLLDRARSGKQVVRLKGGDSFVFGRGGEEVLALQETGLPFEVVPGVTSAVAVPERLGIPVTHRGAARSFTVLTGHTKDGTGENYEALAGLNGTLVVLMGLHDLEEICETLLQNGKPADTPAALLCNGFRDKEQRIDGTLSTIAEEARQSGAVTPAILVVGETAGMDLRSVIPEAGQPSIAVVGTEAFCRKFRSKCPEAVALPMVAIEPVETALTEVPPAGYDWIGFLSSNAIDLFLEQVRDHRDLAPYRLACVGSATEQALKKRGFRADFVPSRFDRDTLAAELAPLLGPDERVLLLGAEDRPDSGRAPLPPAFTHCGLYRTVPRSCEMTAPTDYIVFASSGGVEAYFSNNDSLYGATPVCIGKATATALEPYTDRYLTAGEHTIDGILAAIQGDLS